MRTMQRILIPLAVVVCMAGCDINLIAGGAKTAAEKAEEHGDAAKTAAEKITDAADELAGKPVVSEELAKKASELAETTNRLATVTKNLGEVAKNFVPEEKQPYVELGLAVLGLLTTASAGAAGYFGTQSAKHKKKAQAVIAGADKLAGAGKAIKAKAEAMGIATEVEAEYQELKALGAVE